VNGKRNTPSDLAVTSVRIERDKLEAFKALAAAERRSVSQHLRYLIDQSITEAEQRDGVAA
jgi:hypothetical protein